MGAYSKLHDQTYHAIKKEFPHFVLRENIRPDWLISKKKTRLEIDIYIENINTAVEIQGLQHYQYTPHFHKTYEEFKEQQKRDQEKRDLCYGKRVRLVEIATVMDLTIFINELKERYQLERQVKELQAVMNRTSRMEDVLQSKLKKISRSKKPRKSSASFPGFKEWLRRKILRRKGLLPPAEIFYKEPLPGNRRVRRRARTLELYERENEWVIWGGSTTHLVTKDMQCDCIPHKNGTALCSHVVRVKFETGEIPDTQKEQDMNEEQKQLEQKEPLGFNCGKKCQNCGDKVSRDGQGRYLCFTCGKLVEVKS